MTGETQPQPEDPFADEPGYWESIEPTAKQKARWAALSGQVEWPEVKATGLPIETRWSPGITDVPDPADTLTIFLGEERS